MNSFNVIKFPVKDGVSDWVKEYREVCFELRALERRKARLSSKIKMYMQERDLSEFIIDIYRVSLEDRIRKTLSKELLRGMGVEEGILDECSKETLYQQLHIR